MNAEYIKYVETCQRRWVKPDPDIMFAKNCIQQLDALNVANSAGFYDDFGRAWTLSKRRFAEGGVEIFVKCIETECKGTIGGKNIVKLAWIYPASQVVNDEKGVPVSIGDWIVQVAF